MKGRTMKIWYQSYVNSEIAPSYLSELRRYVQSVQADGFEFVVHEMTPPDSLAHAVMELRCSRQVIKNAIRAEREGYDAFVVGHMQDAGLYEAKAVVNIPVIGLGESSMLHACTLGRKIGIVTINAKYIPWFENQIRRYGLEQRVVGVHAMDFEPGEITRGFDSSELYRDVLQKFRDQCRPLVRSGIEVLIPGGGIPMLLFRREVGFEVDAAPVVNGLPIVVKMAEAAVWLRRHNGMGVSRVSEFAIPPAAYLDEFLETL